MKSYTDINQSKKLAEILPVESADMYYYTFDDGSHCPISSFSKPCGDDLPCWSFAALLNILESEIYDEDGNIYELNIEKDGTWWWIEYLEQYGEANPIEINSTEELIDACYEMILKLHELKLL